VEGDESMAKINGVEMSVEGGINECGTELVKLQEESETRCSAKRK
jgi:uncharacterized Zn-binding protein involved in type VI secretion